MTSNTVLFRVLRAAILAGAAMIAVALQSCASSRPDLTGCVYPPPPDTARFQLEEVWHGPDEFGRSIFDIVLGKRAGNTFTKPYGIAYDSAGNLAVADAFAGGIVFFDKSAQRVRTVTHLEFKLPLNLVFDAHDTMYVVDAQAQRVFVMSPSGTLVRRIGKPGQLINPVGVAVDAGRDRLYVVDSRRHDITVFNTAGDSLRTIGTRGDSVLQFNYPTAVALDHAGNLYVVDAMNFRVQVVSPEGEFIRTFGSVGDGFGQFTRPRCIALDASDHVYVSDAAFNNFQVFSSDGVLLTYIGHAGKKPGEFNQPAGIAFDGKNHIAVVDQINRRLQVFKFLGDK